MAAHVAKKFSLDIEPAMRSSPPNLIFTISWLFSNNSAFSISYIIDFKKQYYSMAQSIQCAKKMCFFSFYWFGWKGIVCLLGSYTNWNHSYCNTNLTPSINGRITFEEKKFLIRRVAHCHARMLPFSTSSTKHCQAVVTGADLQALASYTQDPSIWQLLWKHGEIHPSISQAFLFCQWCQIHSLARKRRWHHIEQRNLLFPMGRIVIQFVLKILEICSIRVKN